MVIRAQSPAGFAEEYIIESIWKNRFAPGTVLPAERELSELIGVTRTTLREVLQRLARDGWLKIQHGKPTRVNDFWSCVGLNVLETLIRLNSVQAEVAAMSQQVLEAVMQTRTLYLEGVAADVKEPLLRLLSELDSLEDTGAEYQAFELSFCELIQQHAGNCAYRLMFNGLRSLYQRVCEFYFSEPEARQAAFDYWSELGVKLGEGSYEVIPTLQAEYAQRVGDLWSRMSERLPVQFPEQTAGI
ncbi:fatty acid metabolism transcriptional regulator FadR [Dongshaea marina]|uniref:fatty acid metabolism transcriptional regulator FadR n=1 Tax=Dongshaea marina TaxID=2047966 RepID=UPI000D3E5E8F|nr:fatty acid metabolism transcriptional regulator FadR [Dongshaea marina]